MADINVERKRPSLWPWLIGTLLLIAMVYLAARVIDGGANTEETRIQVDQ